MFCTDKERQTCDVEKRGCEGCYYKGVSEEDILEECNELAKNEHHELGDCWDEEYSAKAIKGLIKLYNQEKEKNKKLEEEKEGWIKGYSQASEDVVDATIHSIEQKDFYEAAIDLMAEDLFESQERSTNICWNKNYECGNVCDKNCVKEYYFKKARGE